MKRDEDTKITNVDILQIDFEVSTHRLICLREGEQERKHMTAHLYDRSMFTSKQKKLWEKFEEEEEFSVVR